VVDTPGRTYIAARIPAQVTSISDNAQRTAILSRASAEVLTTTNSIFRAIILGRFAYEYPPGASPDWNPDFPTKKIDGYVRDSTGAIVVGATVKLFRQSDDKMVQTTTSSAAGYYTFPRDVFDPNTYYILAYLTAEPQVHGVSDRGSVPVNA